MPLRGSGSRFVTALLGTLGVGIALVGAIGALASLILALGSGRNERHSRAFFWIAIMVSGCVVAVVAMEVALLTDDFSLDYVASNSTKLVATDGVDIGRPKVGY